MTVVLERIPVEFATPEPGYDVEILPDVVDGETVYMARHPQLPGCMSHGDTPQDALDHLLDAREMYLAALESSQIQIPEPSAHPTIVTATLHTETAESADQQGVLRSWRVRTPGGNEMIVSATLSWTTSG